jgi:hypothetical protein
MRVRSILAAGGVGLLALSLGACSSGSSSKTPTTSPAATTPTTSATTTLPPQTAPPTTATPPAVLAAATAACKLWRGSERAAVVQHLTPSSSASSFSGWILSDNTFTEFLNYGVAIVTNEGTVSEGPYNALALATADLGSATDPGTFQTVANQAVVDIDNACKDVGL